MSYTDAEGNVTTVQYDAQGNITSTSDALGNTTAYTYRKDGLLTEIKDASGAITLYEYDSRGRVAKETNALGAVTAYEYDAEDRVVKATAPNGTVTEYGYNTDSNVTKITATKVNGEYETLRYLYTLDGSLTASISSTDILEYTYDKRGYVASVTKNNDHAVSLVYDGNGNLTLLKELEAGQYTPDSITGYSYDARGLLTEVYAGGTLTYKTTSYDRDGLPILTETVKDGELLVSYLSRADGLLEQSTDGAGNVTKYQYNRQKQVTGLTITAADGIILYSEENSYDRNGSLLKQVVSGEGYISETLSYTYDALDRLVKETKNGASISYTYDSMGNRLTKTQNGVTTSYVYDLCNKLLLETENGIETTYTYDTLGNLTEKVSSEGTTTYTYDALNQLTEVVNLDGTWQHNTYDASGIRSMIAENGVTTEFMTFNGLVLSGYNKDGEQTEHYYYGNSLLAAEYANGSTSADAEADLYYYLKNSHGDVIGFTDNTGTLTETYRYDAFGTLTSIQSLNEDGVLVKAETALSRFLYAGEQLDSTTGLYYLRARQYDTVIGRFTQEDTYLGDGRNLYVYVSNNPLKYVDPSGREKSGGYDPVNLYNKNYLFLKPKPKEILELQKQQEEAEKEARKKLILQGSYNVFKGFMETTSGAMVTVTSMAVMPVHPVLGYSGATVGTGYANMGLSNMYEGGQDIYNGITGNVDVPAFNPTRDVFFGGNQEAYNYAEVLFGGANYIFGMGLSNLPLGGPAAGNIAEYANAGSQMMDFLDMAEELVENGSNTVPDSLLQGEANTRVYLGIIDGKPDYVGIASDIERRQRQHGDRFDYLLEITTEPLTRRQARAIEQAMINNHPEFSNKINSISTIREWYDDAITWGETWMKEQGYLK